MDVRQLRYFLAVANEGSFSKASEALHLTQPTLSKVIKQLEDELGVMLFDRSTRHSQLTDAGEVLRAQAGMILKSVEQVHGSLAELTSGTKGSLILGLPPVVGSSIFPPLISAFRKSHPQMEIHLVEEGSKQIERLVLEGRLDLGAIVLPASGTDFELMPLAKHELKLVVQRSHPLAAEESVSLRQLRDQAFILFRRGFALYDLVRNACVQAGFEPYAAYESTQWDFMCEMVAAGEGITFMPAPICRKLDLKQVAVIPRLEPALYWDLAMAWRKDSYLSYAAREWLRFTQEEARRLQQPGRT